MNKRKNKAIIKSRLLILITAILIVLIGSILVIYKDTSLFKNKNVKSPTGNSYTKGISSKNNSASKNNSHSTETKQTNSNTGGSSTTSINNSSTYETLIQPNGNFVSDHHPNLSGYPLSNIETSVCNTTPRSYCQISFSMNGITHNLAMEQTDAGGAAYWNNWSLQSIGLTSGSWKITATATLNGQSKSTNDPLDLVVSQ
ncbi:MAG: hypothetical protein ACYCPS_01630 [Candidatus Saccharimonadales bacterium]